MTIAHLLMALLQAGAAATLTAAMPTAPAAPPPPPPPRIETHANFGFRLRGAGYRLAGGGANVSAQLCRLPGWAGASIALVRFEARHGDGQVYEAHVAYPPRLAIRLGQNCAITAARFKQVPIAGDTVRICTAWHRDACS